MVEPQCVSLKVRIIVERQQDSWPFRSEMVSGLLRLTDHGVCDQVDWSIAVREKEPDPKISLFQFGCRRELSRKHLVSYRDGATSFAGLGTWPAMRRGLITLFIIRVVCAETVTKNSTLACSPEGKSLNHDFPKIFLE